MTAILAEWSLGGLHPLRSRNMNRQRYALSPPLYRVLCLREDTGGPQGRRTRSRHYLQVRRFDCPLSRYLTAYPDGVAGRKVTMSLRSPEEMQKMKASQMAAKDLITGEEVDTLVQRIESYGVFLRIVRTNIRGLCHRREARNIVIFAQAARSEADL